MLILLTTLPNSIGNELHEFIRVICEIRNFILKLKHYGLEIHRFYCE